MKGIYTALITAFDKDGNVDESGMRAVTRYNIDHNQADGIFVCGTMGERFKMSTEDAKKAFKIVADEVKDEVPLMANISAIVDDEIIDLSKCAKELGYEAVGLVPPIFHIYSDDEIVEHYKMIADAIELPLMVYVIPSFSKVDFSLKMLTTLLKHPNIKGMKFTHNDYYLLDRVRVNCPNSTLFTGFDDILYYSLMMGTDGAIGGTFNLTGLFAKKLYQAVNDGDYKAALRYQRNINDVEDMLNETGLPETVKATLQEIGIPCGELKKPNFGITEKQRMQGRKIYKYLQAHKG